MSSPNSYATPPLDSTQYHEWDTAVKGIEIINRFDTLQLERGIERDRGLEL